MEATEVQDIPISPNAAGGQKRSRGYGEELKGLTPDRESDAGESPSAKRPRRSSHGSDLDKSRLDDLDDGEIVESSVAGQAEAQPDQPQTGADSQPDLPQPQQAPLDKPAADVAQPEGESAELAPAEPPAATAENAPAKVKQDKDKSRPSNGWNQGVGLGLRTSFAKPTPKTSGTNSPAVPPPVEPPSIVTFQVMNQDWTVNAASFEQVACGKELDHALHFSAAFWRKWMQQNLGRIVCAVQEENHTSLATIKKPGQRVKVIRNAMNAIVGTSGGILTGIKKDKTAVRETTKKVFDELSPKMLDPLIIYSAKQQEAGSDGSAKLPEPQETLPVHKKTQPVETQPAEAQPAAQVPSPEVHSAEVQPAGVPAEVVPAVPAADIPALPTEELEHRKLYFPGSESSPVFCIHCVSTKHESDSCPQFICQFCESAEHTRYACPAKQRCTKCHQTGHEKASCQEKIALAKDEREPCVFCGISHLEDQCAELWRSFNHAEVDIRKVKVIPTFCYTCGNEGHYGPECGLATRGPELTAALRIWSSSIRDLYIDPDSPNAAIAWAGADPSQIKAGQNFNIRGQAKKKTHVYYVSSDDSDDGFIHEPVQKPGPRGNIQINTNLSHAAPPKRGGGFSNLRRPESQRRQGQREFSPPPPPPPAYQQAFGSWNPPLPSGPPPPLPEAYTFQGNTGALPYPPPGTLPPRPANQGPRNGGGSSQSRNRPRRGRGRGGNR
ncbi:hypothetical protein KJ359_013005 [Pestalotiopsis sp. 9143b]|nr:hypothetical protein KJ359_013005 [Pestalotiopsis sp. 9143b]